MADFKRLNGYNVKDEFARNRFQMIEGSVNITGSYNNYVDINFPTGFNHSNCVIIGVMHQDSENSPYYDGFYTDLGATAQNIRVSLGVYNDVTQEIEDTIRVTVTMDAGQGTNQVVNVKVLLMRLVP